MIRGANPAVAGRAAWHSEDEIEPTDDLRPRGTQPPSMTAPEGTPFGGPDAFQPDAAAAGSEPSYHSRSLRPFDGDGPSIDERQLLAIRGPRIVLGEPGAGKTRLFEELGRRVGGSPVTALRLIHSKTPERLVRAARPFLVDGLDQAIACKEGDAVDAVLSQLEAAGSRNFIISCRVREWQARSVTAMRQAFDGDPSVFELEPFRRCDAEGFLRASFPAVDAEGVLGHLELHGLANLYENPLMLRLVGTLADTGAELPRTRGGLLDRVCSVLWPERDVDRYGSNLSRMNEEQVLSCAGAIMAGLLSAGAEAVRLEGPPQEGELAIADLGYLPDTEGTRPVLSSKLFQGAGVGRAVPIHRVIAEFLAARWLAKRCGTPRVRRRLLAWLNGGGVPASLRGLHAWLAFHSAEMAGPVIAADPFGTLRYGEPAALTGHQAACMLDALVAIAEVDPLFRSQDWEFRSIPSLMVPPLRDRLVGIIGSAASNAHLRLLIIEGLRGTWIADHAQDVIERVMMSGDRFYREREAAAAALLPLRDLGWWNDKVAKLRDQGTDDASRLARKLIDANPSAASDRLIVSVVATELGVTICPLPRRGKRDTIMLRHLGRLAEALSADRLPGVLDELVEYHEIIRQAGVADQNYACDFTADLIARTIEEAVVATVDAPRVWRWLGMLAHAFEVNRKALNRLRESLDTHQDLRRAIQEHGIATSPRTMFAAIEIDLAGRLVGLHGRPGDVSWFLGQLAGADNRDPIKRRQWSDLVSIGVIAGSPDQGVLAAAEEFIRGDLQLGQHLHRMLHPKEPKWRRRWRRREAKRDRKELVSRERHRRHYRGAAAALRAGELRAIMDPARAYLGLFDDLDNDQPPEARIAQWLGPVLAADAVVGFEATLHRAHVPSPQQIADGFATGHAWNCAYAIAAGLLERVRSGKGLAGLGAGILASGLLICEEHRHIFSRCPVEELRGALTALVASTPGSAEAFVRTWIEPSLAAGRERADGVGIVTREERWRAVASSLAGEWLTRFPDLPRSVELELVDCLAHAGRFAELADVAAAREPVVAGDAVRRLDWLAIDVLVRFDYVRPALGLGNGNAEDLIWSLRDRLQVSHRGRMLPTSVEQAKWIIGTFRTRWPNVALHGNSWGDRNGHDAADFLRALVTRLANDTGDSAVAALHGLAAGPYDSYADLLRHMAAEQGQKLAEERFLPLRPAALASLLAQGPPANAGDLLSLAVEELAVAQAKLLGSDIDEVVVFWTEDGVPHQENYCRDRLAGLVGPELARYGVNRMTEADMPNGKRVDLAFVSGQLQLLMEVKGQWHDDVWDAATRQLDTRYLIDWRSEQRGIYCVLWFGDLPSSSGRRLKPPPAGAAAPATPDEMRDMLVERIPAARRPFISVIVLDLRTGLRVIRHGKRTPVEG